MTSPDPVAQYDAAMNTVALFDLATRVQIELRGSDRQTFLNNFCTNDTKKLQPGAGCEAFLTSIKGRILGHIIVSAVDDALWIDSVPDCNDVITGHLDRYVITEDVQILDRSAEIGPLCLVGPESIAWLSDRAGDVADLPLWGQRRATLEGVDVIVRRVGFTVPPAFELVIPHEQHKILSAAITGTGVVSGERDVFEALRIEAGFPEYGVDITQENIAQEAGRTAQAISFIKGCYLGQEPIARLDALGHTNKELRSLRMSDGPVPAAGTRVISADGSEAGRITSAVLSPKSETPVVLAMLKSAFIRPGTVLTVEGAGAASVVSISS